MKSVLLASMKESKPMNPVTHFRPGRRSRFILALAVVANLAALACAADQRLKANEAVEQAHRELWRRFIDPTWHTFYDHAGLDGRVVIPTAEECRADKPNAMSWDISITDGAMFGGFYMEAAIHRWQITKQAEDRQKVRRVASGLMKLATVGQTKGFIARGLTADRVIVATWWGQRRKLDRCPF